MKLSSNARHGISAEHGIRESLSIVNVHRNDETNIGDSAASPSLYIPWLRHAEIVDIEGSAFPETAKTFADAAVIYGGGGVLFDGDRALRHFGANMDALHGSSPKALVLWGAGHNQLDGQRIVLQSFLAKYDLVGIRDYPTAAVENFDPRYHWVPCASCLHPEFDKEHPIEHEVVVYRHKGIEGDDLDFPIDDPAIPVRQNKGNDAAAAIQFLASGETVVTNSYHGAYWGILAGRKVIVVNPFSTKFLGLKHAVPMVPADDWRRAMNEAVAYPEALEECRTANICFAGLVRQLLESL